mmetsp:Transcript_303/g.581  ORF Transcript_303/g.581 Transcript_303/m.581 type:complete len:209 (+) Transcript_303:970-1596(+)
MRLFAGIERLMLIVAGEGITRKRSLVELLSVHRVAIFVDVLVQSTVLILIEAVASCPTREQLPIERIPHFSSTLIAGVEEEAPPRSTIAKTAIFCRSRRFSTLRLHGGFSTEHVRLRGGPLQEFVVQGLIPKEVSWERPCFCLARRAGRRGSGTPFSARNHGAVVGAQQKRARRGRSCSAKYATRKRRSTTSRFRGCLQLDVRNAVDP